MDETLKTVFLRHEKSGLHVHLMKHATGVKYVRIQQTKLDKEQEVHEVNIHPKLLDELVVKLEEYRGLLSKGKRHDGFLYGEEVEELIRRYMSGVTIPELAIQFDSKESDITTILTVNGYPIVDNKLSAHRPGYKRKRRKK